ncbi:hypothetical protein SLS58_007167 [Diplodia intermedia]|uniref:Uncharacterized protein n=1 Tax=Diplodia intermedia TaxID=856260 RepID=A0ABR3TLC7_9PEZI
MAINKSGIASVVTGIHLALPIPAALSFLVIVLPVAQGLSTWYLTRPPAAARRGGILALPLPVSSPPPPLASATATPAPGTTDPRTRLAPPLLIHTLTILTTVLATLSGTYIAPPGGAPLDCALREQWQALYRAKDGDQIRTIQDALRCCGFRSVYDMAWPFPTSEKGGGTRRSTRFVKSGGSGYRSDGQDGRDDGGEGAVRAIDFPDGERYTDDPAEDLEDVERGQTADDGEGVLIDGPRDTGDQQHHTLFPSAHGNGQIENEWGRSQ